MDRRHFLKHLAAISTGSFLTHQVPLLSAIAQDGLARPHLFIYIFARGGWDPTMVFETKQGLEGIDVDPDAEVIEAGGITFLDNPSRPWVKTFFEDFGSQSCIINGIDTKSVSHEVGTEIMMTGSAGTPSPDWPTMISTETGPSLLMPHLALSGPVYSGGMGQGTASGAGFLKLLIGNNTGHPAGATAEASFLQYKQRNFNKMLNQLDQENRNGKYRSDMETAFQRYTELKEAKEMIQKNLGANVEGLEGMATEGITIASAFQQGYAITGTIQARGSWDSHNNNFSSQNNAFDDTFRDLHGIASFLASQNATAGSGTLLDQTTLLVMSEMGRTPKLNSSSGKDHWQYTSALVVGAGVKGSQMLGGTDEYQVAKPVNFTTGVNSDSGAILGSVNLGAAFLELAGIESGLYIPSSVTPFRAFLA